MKNIQRELLCRSLGFARRAIFTAVVLVGLAAGRPLLAQPAKPASVPESTAAAPVVPAGTPAESNELAAETLPTPEPALDEETPLYWQGELARLLALEDSSPGVRERLLLAYRRLDRWQDALGLAEQCHTEAPDDARWTAWYGLALLRAGRYYAAGDMLDAAEAEGGGLPEFNVLAGLYVWHAGAPPDAVAFLARGGLDAAFRREALVQMALLYRDMRNWRQEAFYRYKLAELGEGAWPAAALRGGGLAAEFGGALAMKRPKLALQPPDGFEAARLLWRLATVRLAEGAAEPPAKDAPADPFDPVARLRRWGGGAERVPIIEVSINGSEPLWIALDTLGPPVLTLDAAVAARLDWSGAIKGWPPENPPAALAARSYLVADSMRCGETTLEEVVAVLRDLPLEVEDPAGETLRPLAGVLGVAAFAPLAVTFDFTRDDGLLLEREKIFYDVEREEPMLVINGLPWTVARAGAGGEDAPELLFGIDSLARRSAASPALSALWPAEAPVFLLTHRLGGSFESSIWLDQEVSPMVTAQIGYLADLGTLSKVFETISFEFASRAVVGRAIADVPR